MYLTMTALELELLDEYRQNHTPGNHWMKWSTGVALSAARNLVAKGILEEYYGVCYYKNGVYQFTEMSGTIPSNPKDPNITVRYMIFHRLKDR